MPTTTTIKVPVELRDRLAAVAEREGTSLAGAIAKSLQELEDARFWRELADTMPTIRADADAALTDGLDPDESWDDVW